MEMLPMKKRKRRYWVNLYWFSMSLIVVISIYNRRAQVKRLLGMV
jgi:hypothetical protein